MRLEENVASLFIRQKRTLAAAESCTGGLLSHTLTNVAGSSAFFFLGVVAYDNAAKAKILKVPAAVLKKYGAVSPQAAQKMAQGVRRILETDVGIAITGIAGPGGGSKKKPVGLAYIALDRGGRAIVHEYHFKGGRLSIKKQAATAALLLLKASLA